ncbi:MAG: hypothetical protein JWN24_2460 [Phycisphaerales bacterium]|nr:hypothetical protein [Phycisphaerales bacterium]
MAVPGFSLWVLVIGLVLLAMGAFMLKRGRWPRRVGQTPHCGKCDYILSGDGLRCSECGTLVKRENVVWGERNRRPGLSMTGGVLALLGLAFLMLFATGFTGTIDWNRHKPLGWLLKDLGNGSQSIRSTAWGEVQRRLDGKLLSDEEQSSVVNKGLQFQSSGLVTTSSNNILDFIAQRYLDHKLTPAQAAVFFAGALKVNLAVRPVVGAQSQVPYSLSGAGRGPGGWWMRMRTLETQIDDGPIQKAGGGMGASFGGWSTSSSLPPVGTAGKHRLRVKVELATDPSTSGVNWNDNAPVAKRITQDLTADFNAIEGQTPITTTTDPPASVLQPLLTVRLHANTVSQFLDANIDAAALPVDVAFDVFVRFNGREFPVGGVNFHKGATSGYGSGVEKLPADAPAKVDVILRSSEAVARQTMDLTHIWKGEIVLKDVPINRPPAASPATAPAATQSGQ